MSSFGGRPSSSRLNNRAARLLADEGNRDLVSVASIWEITIKRRVRKLAFEGTVTDPIASGFLDIPVFGRSWKWPAIWNGTTMTHSTA